jgi:hypothetical protein
MAILSNHSSVLVKVLEYIKVELRIANCSYNSEVLSLNYVIILLHLIVRRCTCFLKNSV